MTGQPSVVEQVAAELFTQDHPTRMGGLSYAAGWEQRRYRARADMLAAAGLLASGPLRAEAEGADGSVAALARDPRSGTPPLPDPDGPEMDRHDYAGLHDASDEEALRTKVSHLAIGITPETQALADEGKWRALWLNLRIDLRALLTGDDHIVALESTPPKTPRFVAVDEREKACTDAWPDCARGEYNPSCCRFPKSCSVPGRYGLVPVDDPQV